MFVFAGKREPGIFDSQGAPVLGFHAFDCFGETRLSTNLAATFRDSVSGSVRQVRK